MTASGTHPTIDTGEGPPVVFLHGAPDHRTEWNEVIERLRADVRCLAPDLPGFGDADAPPPSYDSSIDAQAEWLDRWLSATVGETPVGLVAHDIGAVMGAAWASRHPERVRYLVLMNTVLWSGHRWRGAPRVWASPVLGPLFMAVLNRPAWRLAFRRDFPALRPAQVERMYDGLTPTARRTLLRYFRAMTAPDHFTSWDDRFQALPRQVPVTLLWGADDPMLSAEDAHRLGVAPQMLDGCSHWVPLERPEAVADAVRRANAA